VLDSAEGHQWTPPDQTYDIICHMAKIVRLQDVGFTADFDTAR
jgi:hypothetical protein